MPFRKEDNHFAEEDERRARRPSSSETGAAIDYDLTHLLNDDIRDPRITEGHESRRALITLAHSHYYLHAVGRKANLILTPESAGEDYRQNPSAGEANLDQLFNNIPDNPRTEDQVTKVNAVVNQAVNAAREWQTRAVQNHRPIYTGISGHMLSYARIFVRSEDPARCKKKDHPELEQLRITLLASLIGFNQHHTYEECMTALHGSTHHGVMLQYKDHVGFFDIIDSEEPFIRDKIGKLMHGRNWEGGNCQL